MSTFARCPSEIEKLNLFIPNRVDRVSSRIGDLGDQPDRYPRRKFVRKKSFGNTVANGLDSSKESVNAESGIFNPMNNEVSSFVGQLEEASLLHESAYAYLRER